MLARSLCVAVFILTCCGPLIGEQAKPFGPDFPRLDSDAVGEWWKTKGKGGNGPRLMVPRDEVLGFALYTVAHRTLKLTAQLFPLLPEESRDVTLEICPAGDDPAEWQEIAVEKVMYPGWSAHFRVQNWDASRDFRYRLRHGDKATFEGVIRKDPLGKDTIVVGSLSCNSSRTPGPRPRMIENLIKQDGLSSACSFAKS